MNKLLYKIDSYIRVTKETKYLVLELCSSFGGLILLYIGMLLHSADPPFSMSILQPVIELGGIFVSLIGITGFLSIVVIGNYHRIQVEDRIDKSIALSLTGLLLLIPLIAPSNLFLLVAYGFGVIMLVHIFVSTLRIVLSFYKSAEYGEHIDPPPPIKEVKNLDPRSKHPAFQQQEDTNEIDEKIDKTEE